MHIEMEENSENSAADNKISSNQGAVQNCIHELDHDTKGADLNDQSETLFLDKEFGVYNLEDKLKVSDDKVIAVLVHFDNTHKNIEETLWEVQIEEKEKVTVSGINSAYLYPLALVKMKSNYLKLL